MRRCAVRALASGLVKERGDKVKTMLARMLNLSLPALYFPEGADRRGGGKTVPFGEIKGTFNLPIFIIDIYDSVSYLDDKLP